MNVSVPTEGASFKSMLRVAGNPPPLPPSTDHTSIWLVRHTHTHTNIQTHNVIFGSLLSWVSKPFCSQSCQSDHAEQRKAEGKTEQKVQF